VVAPGGPGSEYGGCGQLAPDGFVEPVTGWGGHVPGSDASVNAPAGGAEPAAAESETGWFAVGSGGGAGRRWGEALRNVQRLVGGGGLWC